MVTSAITFEVEALTVENNVERVSGLKERLSNHSLTPDCTPDIFKVSPVVLAALYVIVLFVLVVFVFLTYEVKAPVKEISP